ncbi:MAG: tetratricopeptide repeat protein [Planctomycetota bacterium]|jgi:tetratricopeptide (TPR) repeat protein
MATENQENIREENTSELPSDSELFAAPLDNNGIHEELSERDIFAGDEAFYKSLPDSTQSGDSTAATGPVSFTDAADVGQLPLMPIMYNRFSNLQKILIAGIVIIAAILTYAVLKSSLLPHQAYSLTPTLADQTTPIAQQTPPTQSTPSTQPPPTTQQIPPTKQPIQAPTFAVPQQARQPSLHADIQTQPQSLEVAQNFYLQGDYKKAYDAYNQLRESLLNSLTSGETQNQFSRDFLQLRMAMCKEKTADFDQAGRLFRTVSKSRSAAVSTVANYHLCLFQIQKKQYLRARTKAYQILALIDTINFDKGWALSLQRDCHFIIAQCLTDKILSLTDTDKNQSEDLWSRHSTKLDPFTKLTGLQLRSALNSGSEQLSESLLSPQIQKVEQQEGTPRWSVTCNNAPTEELLTRFAANANLDIHWQFLSAVDLSEEIRNPFCQKPLILCLSAATTQQVTSTAAGYAGLLARLDNKGTINIFNPAEYSLLSEHISLLSEEAILLWQKFLLTFHDDQRLPNAHFALALLYSQKGRVTEAIAEYKLVANRFSQTSLAPFALLRASRLKTNLRDYSGARQDLLQLVELYPDTEIAEQACLYLADATMKARLYDEAQRLYRKAYNLGLSVDSQAAAALGAGKCCYEKKQYQVAAKWLNRYVSLAKNQKNKTLYSAFFLLGKVNFALGKYQQAYDAFQYSLAGQLSGEEYIKIVSALIKTQMKQQHFIQSLNILENIQTPQLSQEQFIELLLLKSRILQEMGLIDRAFSILADKAGYIPDQQLKAKISFELANYYIANEKFELARKKLTELLILVEPGPLAHEIALKLADVCLKLDHNPQTISICSQLLDLEPPEQIKQKALVHLATAYKRQKNYDRAALVLLGRWNKTRPQSQ